MSKSKKTVIGKASANKNGGDPGFFQTSFDRLLEIANDPELGVFPLATYLVLAGGVNSFEDESRSSTHWVESVRNRSRLSAPEILEALGVLVQKGYIELPKADPTESTTSVPRMFKVKCRVDPHAPGALSDMSQRFLAAMVISGDARIIQPASLAHLFQEIKTIPSMSWKNALLDALIVFFALHQHQDFDRYAGVDPRLVHTRFGAPPPGHLDGVASESAVGAVVDWTLVNAVPNRKMETPRTEFLESTLGGIPHWEDSPPLIDRFKLALRNLKDARLLYRAHVLWAVDPTRRNGRLTVKPHFTLYVHDSWDTDREQSLQLDVHKTATSTGTVTGAEVFAESRGEKARHVGNNVFSYILPKFQLKSATLLTQYRVRWWPANKKTFQQLDGDQIRIDRWRAQLKAVEEASAQTLQLGQEQYDYDEM